MSESHTLPGFSTADTVLLAAVAFHTADGATDFDKVMEHVGSKSVASVKERLRVARKKTYESATDGTAIPTIDGEKVASKSATPRKRITIKRKADTDATAEGENNDCTETPIKKARKTAASKSKAASTEGDKNDENEVADVATPLTKKARKPRTPKSKAAVDDSDGNHENEDEVAKTPVKKQRAKAGPKTKGAGAKGVKKESEDTAEDKNGATDEAGASVPLKKEASPDSALTDEMLDAQLNCDTDEDADTKAKLTAFLADTEMEMESEVTAPEI